MNCGQVTTPNELKIVYPCVQVDPRAAMALQRNEARQRQGLAWPGKCFVFSGLQVHPKGLEPLTF
jgi:hypothetical protein